MSDNRLPLPGEPIRARHTGDGREVVGRLLAGPDGEPITQSGDDHTFARMETADGRRTWILYSTDPEVATYALTDRPLDEAPPEMMVLPPDPPQAPPSRNEDPGRFDEFVGQRLVQAQARRVRREAPAAVAAEEQVPEEEPIPESLRSYFAFCDRTVHCKERPEPVVETAAPVAPEKPKTPDLRPQTLEQYDVGQGAIIRKMRVALAAALSRGTALPHVLMSGPPGLGKTTLAYVIANELGTKMHQTSGPALEEPSSLVGLLSNIREGDILFIDEIHTLSTTVCEYLYQVMEDFRIDYIEGEKGEARTVVCELPRFTVIGATTNTGGMPRPLRDRFKIPLHLEFYTDDQLALIADRSARTLGTSVAPPVAQVLASRARGTARIVNRLLERCCDWALILDAEGITEEVLDITLDSEEIDEAGLEPLDRRYLRTIEKQYNGGPVGIQAIAATLGEERSIVSEVIEPYLLLRGFVARTPRGRDTTERGRLHMAGRD